jgi:hypothetical protein
VNKELNIFIGSGEASLVERYVLLSSLRGVLSDPCMIHVFNGTHNSIEWSDGRISLAPLSLRAKYKNFTEFSLYRFLLPELCEFRGWALWVDSDIICLQNPLSMFQEIESGLGVYAAKGEKEGSWDLGVMLVDCSCVQFNLERWLDLIEQGVFSYSEMMSFSPGFLQAVSFKVGELPRRFNSHDKTNEDTCFLHYTNLTSQPWKFDGHNEEQQWFMAFKRALDAGDLDEGIIEKSRLRGYVRQDLMLKLKSINEEI